MISLKTLPIKFLKYLSIVEEILSYYYLLFNFEFITIVIINFIIITDSQTLTVIININTTDLQFALRHLKVLTKFMEFVIKLHYFVINSVIASN